MHLRGKSIVAALAITVAVVSMEARQAGAPLPPTLLPAIVANLVVTLSWVPNGAGPAATAYQIHVGSGPGLSDIAVFGVAPVPTVLTSGAPPGTYFVRLVALNGAVASAPSNEIIVVVAGGGGCSPPGVPTGLTATVAGGSVTVRWTASLAGGAPISFALLVGSVPGGLNIGTFVVGLVTTVTSPAPPGQYDVRAVATNACGSSAPSNEASFVIGGGAGPLSLPAGVYQGTIANHNRFSLPPITSFTLQLNQAVPAGGLQMISGRWTDNRGCVKTSGIFGGMPVGLPQISVESLACNDGDFGLRVTSVNGNVYSGICLLGGPNCTFQMTRQ